MQSWNCYAEEKERDRLTRERRKRVVANDALKRARKRKDDEFYTKKEDVIKEFAHITIQTKDHLKRPSRRMKRV